MNVDVRTLLSYIDLGDSLLFCGHREPFTAD